ncbi:MAG: phosphate ABC transporter substrate-binding protein [Anaerolineales bacterium]
MSKSILLLCILFIVLLSSCTSKSKPSSNNPDSSPIYSIVNKGSDTLVNLALAWAERYRQIYPNVEISVTGGGSGTGIAAIINGTVDIANASRQIKPEEIQLANNNGVNPVEHIVAKDAIAIIVNPENPVSQLTIQQLSDIYSGKINNWKEVGGNDQIIVRLSRETNSGTHVFFLENVIRLGDSKNKTLFSTDTLLLPSSEGITAETRDNPSSIGYDGLGYVTPDVKVIAVGMNPAGPFILPSANTVNNGQYPIARDLYMYTNGQPTGAVADYLEWIMVSDAQAIVTQLGFVPIKIR